MILVSFFRLIMVNYECVFNMTWLRKRVNDTLKAVTLSKLLEETFNYINNSTFLAHRHQLSWLTFSKENKYTLTMTY